MTGFAEWTILSAHAILLLPLERFPDGPNLDGDAHGVKEDCEDCVFAALAA